MSIINIFDALALITWHALITINNQGLNSCINNQELTYINMGVVGGDMEHHMESGWCVLGWLVKLLVSEEGLRI